MPTDQDREHESIEILRRHGVLPRDPNNPPFKGELTTIWDHEKADLIQRCELNAQCIARQVEQIDELKRNHAQLEIKCAEAFAQAAEMMGELKQRVEVLEGKRNAERDARVPIIR